MTKPRRHGRVARSARRGGRRHALRRRLRARHAALAERYFFFFQAEDGIRDRSGIPAEPLFRSAVQPDIEAERKKRDEIEAGKSYCSRRFGGATCDDKSAQIYARFDKNDWRIQPAEFYRFHDAEVNTFGYF